VIMPLDKDFNRLSQLRDAVKALFVEDLFLQRPEETFYDAIGFRLLGKAKLDAVPK
jgi:hypothetical protein